MKNRREFLALFRGAVLGGAAAVVGFRTESVPEPIYVPNDRLPMVTWFDTSGTAATALTGTTYSFTQHGCTTFSEWDGTNWVPAGGLTA